MQILNLPGIFEQLIAEFIKEPKLGVASGTLVFDGKIEHVEFADQTTRGATMLIRNEVFHQAFLKLR